MRSRWINIAFFLFGAAVFVYLISQFGFDRIVENISRAGWSLLVIILIWLVIYLANTVAWKLVLGNPSPGISFVHLFLITVSGFVINYMTPFLALGGEPYKIKALSGPLGTRRSVSAVILYRMVHLVGHMFLLLTGTIAALLVLPLDPALHGALFVAAFTISAVIALTVLGHRNGVFIPLQNVFNRVRLLNLFARPLEKYRENLSDMDAVLTDVYHRSKRKFIAAIVVEYLSRICMAFEVYLILYGVGVEIGVVDALFIYVVYSIVINLFFFVPLNLGAREGGLYFGLGSLAFAPLLGIYLGVVIRIREFVWILIGLLFIPLTARMAAGRERAGDDVRP